jgi:inorganic pyrophosphatase
MSDTLDPDGDPVDGCSCSACRRRRGEDVSILWVHD